MTTDLRLPPPPLTRRPVSVTLIAWLFIATGVAGLVYHAREFRTAGPLGFALVCLVRLLAVVGGGFLLRGRQWARWLLVGWMAFHVVLSVLHTPVEVVMHAVLLGVIAYFLFRPKASGYFRGAGAAESRT